MQLSSEILLDTSAKHLIIISFCCYTAFPCSVHNSWLPWPYFFWCQNYNDACSFTAMLLAGLVTYHRSFHTCVAKLWVDESGWTGCALAQVPLAVHKVIFINFLWFIVMNFYCKITFHSCPFIFIRFSHDTASKCWRTTWLLLQYDYRVESGGTFRMKQQISRVFRCIRCTSWRRWNARRFRTFKISQKDVCYVRFFGR